MKNLLSSSLLSKNIKIVMYRTVILSVVLYGCETWSLTLEQEHRLMVLEITVRRGRKRRRIFEPKKKEETREWRRLHDGELYARYPSAEFFG